MKAFQRLAPRVGSQLPVRNFCLESQPRGQVLCGKTVAKACKKRVKKQVKEFQEIVGRAPGLAVLLVGNRPDSAAYVMSKTKTCAKLGMPSFQYNFPESVRESEIFTTLDYLNKNDSVDGILVQLPLPKHLDEDRLIQYINPHKDVDGLNINNVGTLTSYGDAPLKACTPSGIIALLDSTGEDLTGMHAVIMGRSDIVGKPMASLLLARNCTVTVCHSRTKDLQVHLGMADIVVAALGKPEFVRGDWIKEGAIVIDVGINKVVDPNAQPANPSLKKNKNDGFKLVGDVHYESCAPKASFITPVPGGVGPMTIAMLLQNTVTSGWARYKRANEKKENN